MDTAATLRRQKRVALAWFFVLSFAAGLLAAGMFQSHPGVPYRAVVTIISAVWCTLDARAHGRPLSRRLLIGIILLPVVFVPVHLLLSRGRRGLAAVAVAAVLLAIGAVLAAPGQSVAN